jgi:predicted transcriptional regulator of viral defense system
MLGMTSHAALARVAARQLGLFTTDQAIDAGLSEWAIRRNLRTGTWNRVRHRVLSVGGSPVTWEQTVLAAVMATSSCAVASHDTSAELWELPDLGSRTLEVTTDRPSWVRQPGVRSHRTTTFLREEHTVHRGVPVTTVARTLVDLSARYSVAQLGAAADEAVRKGRLRLDALRRCAAELAPAPGRRMSRVHSVLGKRLPGYDPGESDLEMRVLRAVVGAGLPEPVQQHRVTLSGRRCRIDLAYPELKVAIEVDGWDYHRTRTAFDADRARENDLVAEGWRMLRFTSLSVPSEIARVVGALLAELSRKPAA